MSTSQDEPPLESSGKDEVVRAELVGGSRAARWRSRRAAPRREPFGVPSHFGIGTLLVVTAAYGMLLAALIAIGCDRRFIAWVVVFISLVGAGQMLLFQSRRPRQASVIVGAVALPALVLMSFNVHGGGGIPSFAILCFLTQAVMLGAPAGYLAGGLVASVFLMMDAVERAMRWLAARH